MVNTAIENDCESETFKAWLKCSPMSVINITILAVGKLAWAQR
jgi:hypothetical protein